MSVANVFFLRDRIFCLSDTIFYDGKEAAGLHKTKTETYGRMAITTRGLVRAGNAVKAVASSYTDVDAAKPALDEAHALILDHKRGGDDAISVETTLMGWSDSRGDLVTYRWEVVDGTNEVRFSELPRGMHLAPSFLSLAHEVPDSLTDAQMVKVGLAQHKMKERMNWSMCIGGVMHVTEITKDNAAQRIVGTFPDYEMHAEMFGCPNYEAVKPIRWKMAA